MEDREPAFKLKAGSFYLYERKYNTTTLNKN